MVFLLLKAGAHLNKTSSGLNTCTAHLEPTHSVTPNVHILKMLSIAGADLGDKDTHENNSLKGLTRACIRRYLKQTHPESNLYRIVPKLGLPFILQSYLLFDTLPTNHQDLNNDEQEFLLKVSEVDIKNASDLIKRGVDVNVQNDNGMTALMIASEAGHVELLVELLGVGADVNIQNSVGDTALILATMEGQPDSLEILMKFEDESSIQGKDGFTALMHAAKSGNVNCLQMLVDGGADPNIPNYDDRADRIIRIDGRNFIGDSRGTTAIIYAAHHGKADCVKKLIEAGADVNNAHQDNGEREGNTPLMAAIGVLNVRCVRELIQAGADLNIPDKNGLTALMGTSGYGSCLPELMKAGAEVNPAFLANIARKLLVEENTGGIQMNCLILTLIVPCVAILLLLHWSENGSKLYR